MAVTDASNGEIDWGDLGTESGSTATQYGSEASAGEEEGGIDFGEGEIDFGNELEGLDMSDIVVEGGGEDKQGEEERLADQNGEFSHIVLLLLLLNCPSITSVYLTLLEDMTVRNMVLDDLMELQEFLQQRVNELSSDTGSLLLVSQVCSFVCVSVCPSA